MTLNNELQSLLQNLSDDWEKETPENQKLLLSLNRKEKISNFLREIQAFVDKDSRDNNTEGYRTYRDDSKHVACFGATGTAKSTFINNLIGNELECIRLGRNGQTIQIRVNSTGNEIAAIGNSDDSQTVTITPYYNERENIVYWDFPGFFDTQGDMQRIRNAFLMKRFSEMVPIAKIILFVDISAISSSRGVSFISFIDMLTAVCPPEFLQENLALLITKVDPFESDDEREEEKHEFVQRFAYYSDQGRSRSGILRILGNDNMVDKLAFFEKPKRTGILPQEMFSDLVSTLQNIRYSAISFKLSVDSDTFKRLANIATMLNKFAKEIMADAEQAKAIQVKAAVADESFTKDKLKEIGPFSIFYNKDIFIERFQSSFCSSAMENSLAKLKEILKTLNFFNQLNPNFEANIFNWAHPLTTFNDKYNQLCERPDTKGNGVKNIIKAAILSTSYLQNILKDTNVKIVECHSLVFVVDSDLDLPGVTLIIFSKIWNIKGERKISLKGNRKKGILNSGNFYGYAENVKGGSILLELDGVEGEDGKFDLTHVNAQINDKRNEIDKLEKYLQAVNYLKSYKGKNLEEEIKQVTQVERKDQNHLKEIMRMESELENYAIARDDSEIAREKSVLEWRSKRLRHKIQSSQKKLILVRKLNDLIKICNKYKNIPKKPSSNSALSASDENTKARLVSGIAKARADVFKTENKFFQLLASNDNDLEGLQNILVELDTNLFCLTNFVENHSTWYLEWKEHKEAIEKKYFEKHTILVEGVEIDLSAGDLNGILSENEGTKSKFEKGIDGEIKAENKLLAFYNKLIQDTKEGIKKLREKQEEVKRCSDDKATKRRVLSHKIAKLKEMRPSEFSSLEKIFQKISEATQEKNAITAEYYSILRVKDIYLGDSASKSYLPEKREFYGDINKKEFYENCVQQIQKMENEAERLGWVKNYITNKINVKLIDAVNKWNELVSTLRISGQAKYEVDVNESIVKEQYENSCKKLKSHLLKVIPMEYTKYFLTGREAILDAYAISQVALKQNYQERLINAQEYKNRMDITLENYENVKIKVNAANKVYECWKNQQKSNLNVFVHEVIKAYDELNLRDKKLKQALVEEGEIVKQLLLKETNLVKRVERTWGDRDLRGKIAQVFRSILTFNDQYHESYKLSGSEGIAGNDSGFCYLNRNWDSFITVSNTPGKGGQHACTLEGEYLNEYCFAGVRGIDNPTNFLETAAKGILAAPFKFLDDFILAAAPKAAARATTLGVSAGYTIGLGAVATLGFVATPLSVWMNSCWVDGPYKTYPGYAPNGKMADKDVELIEQCDNYGENLKNIFSVEILSFF